MFIFINGSIIHSIFVDGRKIVDALVYYPEDTQLYSTTGCKRVAQKVSMFIADERFSHRFRHDNSEL